jgi:hypothetical protein
LANQGGFSVHFKFAIPIRWNQAIGQPTLH